MDASLDILLEKKKRLQEGLELARKAQFEAEGKMQSRYDTQKEDAAQDVAMYTALITNIDELIKILKQLKEENIDNTDHNTVAVGRRVSIKFDDGEIDDFLLLDKAGGVDLGNFQTLSTQSPLGSAILGKHLGERVHVKMPNRVMVVEIMSIR